jgi:aryl-alcohol dehydrogenase-like predicted oxidoreductase
VREKRGLAYAVYSYRSLFVDTGAFVVYAGTTPQNAETVGLLQELAIVHGWTPAQIAISWVVNQPLVSTTLLGARNVDQFRENLAALQCQLPVAEWRRLAAISAPPPEYPYDFLEYANTV